MLKASAQDTRQVIVDAALETLKEKGFAGASARAIAGRGGFNQALVFYHFGSVTNLLLSALDETSRRRMAAYRAALDGSPDLEAIVGEAVRLYREDLASGHITVLTEMIAGSLTHPGLKDEIRSRMEPWFQFSEDAITKVIGTSPLATIVPTRDLARGLVALYLGIEMLSHLEEGSSEAIERLFVLARPLMQLAAPLLG